MPPTVVVTGDHGLDFNIYLPSDADSPAPDAPQTIIKTTLGGAGLVERLLSRTSADGQTKFQVRLALSPENPCSPISALWHPMEIGRVGSKPKCKVWRIKRSLSLGEIQGGLTLPVPQLPESCFAPKEKQDYASTVLVINDDGAKFRFKQPAAFKSFLSDTPADSLPDLVILKTTAPIGHGELWWSLTKTRELAERLVVVLSVNDLRRSDIRISQGISWERTALDLVRELQCSPSLASLRRARHVIITLYGEGALWMEQAKDSKPVFKLFFDPDHVEGEWSANMVRNGEAYGYHSTFIASLAASHVRAAHSEKVQAIGEGIGRGLTAMRVLKAIGDGPFDPRRPAASAPDFPTRVIAGILLGNTAPIEISSDCVLENLGSFASVGVPAAQDKTSWRIIESISHDAPTGKTRLPLYGKARRVALLGLRQLADVPHARFGKCFTADRDEIESLRNLKRLIEAYQKDRKESRPLSLAVFGPPGAGKSFGIKQIAESVVDDRDRAFLEFNLSQFSDAKDLIGAFHQVRDKVLDGKMPIVFWDEFDSRNYQWLQYLLAPMQDGKFQEGQLTHPIGRCIFVFAGATSYTCENFGPPKTTPSDEKDKKDAYADFVLKKGPDFVSRLHGSLNVLGPNPRQKFNGSEWEDDPTDICFPVRRAILLRSMLGLMEERTASKRLEIDPGLLSAILEVGHYKYGSRSFEKIITAIKQGAVQGYHRSNLPPDEVLSMNVVELEKFKALLDEISAILPHADLLAAAIHARWLGIADPSNSFRVEYERLDDQQKADNIAAALRIPVILGLLGLRLAPLQEEGEAITSLSSLPQDQMEALSEEEHIGWMNVRLRNGWAPVERAKNPEEKKRQRAQGLHDCLVPYDKLPDSEKDKDRGSIRWYPNLAELAGFKIVTRT